MANNLTVEKLKGLWARREYIFKDEENQKIIKRFEFLEHLFDAIVDNENSITIEDNKAKIGEKDITFNGGSNKPSAGDFGPSNDGRTEGGNGNSLKNLEDAFGRKYSYTYKDKDNKDKNRDWIKDIYCMMGGFDIDNPKIMHGEYRILGNGQKDSDEGTTTGQVAWPSYHFSNETYFFNVMKTIQNIHDIKEDETLFDSKIVLRSKYSCFGEDKGNNAGEKFGSRFKNEKEWNEAHKCPNQSGQTDPRSEDEDIAEIQRKWLKTRFPYKFFYMWTHRDCCVHLLGLKAFQEICSDKKDEIKFVVDTNTSDFESFVKENNSTSNWKSYSKSLLETIGFNKMSQEDKKKAPRELSLLLSIYFLQTPGILNMEELLKTGNQAIILWGPPGTGKTYHAKQLVRKLLNLKDEDNIEDHRFDNGKEDSYRNGSYDIVQFHPNYTYEDFIGGIMPKCEGRSLSYEVVSGKFKEFCDKANNYSKKTKEGNIESKYEALLKICYKIKSECNDYEFPEYFTNENTITSPPEVDVDSLISQFNSINDQSSSEPAAGNKYSLKELRQLVKDTNEAIDYYNEKKNQELSHVDLDSKPFIFIIDEINRADLSAVFGELMYALEYRNEGVKIPHFKEPFVIPDNVYVIGTMNNVDKSLVSFDLALRRRFGFYKVMPQMVVLSDILSGKIGEDYIEPYITRCSELNKYISENANDNKHLGLGKDYQIGHAYFAKIEDFVYNRPDNHKIITTDDLEKLWVYHVMPLLEEYLGSRTEDEDIKKKLEAIYKEFTKTLD